MITPEAHTAKDGAVTYKVRFRLAGKQTSETFPTRKEAQQFARWLDALGPQGAVDQLYTAEQAVDVARLDEIAADHIALLTGIEPGTRKRYTRLWELTWSKHLGRLPANRVTRDDVARAVNALAGHYSHKSLENQRGLLAAVMTRCVDLGYLTKNPARGIRLPRGKEGERVEMVVMTPDEFATIIGRVPAHYQLFVEFLAGTGVRWGEAVALEVRDVQLPNVRIRRALKWSPDKDRQVGATKTKKSNRTVVIPPVLHHRLQVAIAGKAKTDLVFTAPKGGMILHRTFWSRVWLPAVEGIDPRPRIHDLRHTHASWLLAAGVPIHIVQARLGHESIQTTVGTYGHLLPDAQIAAANAAELALSPAALGAGTREIGSRGH